MKIAALIVAHAKPFNLSLLINRLSGPLWAPYIHIDAKSDINQFLQFDFRRFIIPDRHTVHWGGFGQVEATLSLLRRSVADKDLTHFYLMSAQCFPIKTDDYIINQVIKAEERQEDWITVAKMPLRHKPISRIKRNYYFNGGGRARIIANRILSLVAPRNNINALLRGHDLYAGRNWWLLRRETVESMLHFLDGNEWYKNAFRHSHCADEMFFQTLFKLLNFSRHQSSPTAALWRQGNRNPETITPESYLELKSGRYLFARKFEDFYP